MFRPLLGVGVLILATSLSEGRLQADDSPAPRPKSAQAWTLDEAKGRLQFDPDDAYLQYVALQLAANENKAREVGQEIVQLTWRGWRAQNPDRRVDLFDVFSGATAVQESLQLDTMRGQAAAWIGQSNDPARNTVLVSGLHGPDVKSHPWGKMLAAQEISGKKAQVSPLSLCVPDDQYYIEFRTLAKLLDVVEAGDLWGDHIFSQAVQSAQTQKVSERLKTQLAMQTDPLIRPFYDMVVKEVAVTGSDLYLREGSDVTMLFEIKQPEVFRLRMDGFLETALKSHPDAVRSTGKILGVDYVQVATPDRAVSAFSAYPRTDLHVRSNSKAALQRVLAAIDGKRDVARLGETTEFKYIRTLMVRGDEREDGFLYLSDPFIRRLVGPELKLTERRRMLCYNHLRMIGHAAMLYRTQYGKPAASLAELADGGCLPSYIENDMSGNPGLIPPVAVPVEPSSPQPARRATKPKEPQRQAGRFGEDIFFCPCGGKYKLSDDGTTGVCSCHGHARQMVPCMEIPLDRVTPPEGKEYEQFVQQYSLYWRRYFDPIAVRFQATPKKYRVETIILPLIDNTIYSGLAATLGGEPEPLDALPVPKRNILSLVLRLDKEKLLDEQHPLGPFLRDFNGVAIKQQPDAATVKDFFTKGIGNQMGLHIYDASPLFDFNTLGFMGTMMGSFGGNARFGNEMLMGSFLLSSLNSPVYLALPVKDAKLVDKFLDELDASLAVMARRPERGFIDLGYDFYKVPLRGTDKRIRCFGIGLENILKWRMFVARLDDGLYIASKQFILEDLAAMKKGQPGGGPVAHGMVRVRPDHWKEVLPEFQLGWEENARMACLKNLGPLSAVARAAAAASDGPAKAADVCRQADALHAVHFFCPDGGQYVVSADGKEVTCSVHGDALAPKQLLAPAPQSPTGRLMKEFGGATAELTFLEDGLHAVITIDRK
jgi:hypothetical protein